MGSMLAQGDRYFNGLLTQSAFKWGNSIRARKLPSGRSSLRGRYVQREGSQSLSDTAPTRLSAVAR